MYSETCLNRTLNKPESCIDQTLSKVSMYEIAVTAVFNFLICIIIMKQKLNKTISTVKTV
jgi:hypothetical protein